MPPVKSVAEEFEPYDWTTLAPHPVIGIDEVGRGCLAGPVYAAAAILKPDRIARLQELGVTDSKLLTEAKREKFSLEIQDCAWVGIGFATAQEIDQINILQATFLAMRRALLELLKRHSEECQAPFGLKKGHLLIDGNQKLPIVGAEFVSLRSIQQTTLIKGDLRALPIAAASIVAKVTRDRVMMEAGEKFPQYGFEKHKGYAAPIHRQAIAQHGPIDLHRKTFGGVKEHIRL